MTTISLLALTAAPARVVIAVAVGGAIALIAAPCVRPAVRPVGSNHPSSEPRARRDGALPARATALRSNPLSAVGAALRRWRRRARPSTPPDEVASWCDDVARRCRSGSSLADAIVGTSPSAPHLRRLVDGMSAALQRGTPLRTALHDLDPANDPSVHLAASVMAASARVGGPVARPLDRAAATLRLRHADELDRAAQSAQARMSAQVLTAVPIGALALLATIDPDVRAVLGSPVGLALVTAGASASTLGWWWMTRIVRGAST